MASEATDPRMARPSVRLSPRARNRRRVKVRRRALAALLVLAALVGGAVVARRERTLLPHEVPGSPAWAQKHYGNPDAKRFKARHIVEIEFLGRAMFVHEEAQRHFLRLESLF